MPLTLPDNFLTSELDFERDKAFLKLITPDLRVGDNQARRLGQLLERIKYYQSTGAEPSETYNFFKRVRLFALVLKNRPNPDPNVHQQEKALLDEISALIGQVPRPNAMVSLPTGKNNWPQYKTIGNWARTPYIEPKRKKGEIDFFTNYRTKKAGVREELLTESEEQDTISFYKKEGILEHFQAGEARAIGTDLTTAETRYMGYTDAEFLPSNELDVDHLQPSEDILARQKELVEAMNVDSLFAKELMEREEDPENAPGYFVQVDGIYYGTKNFYMEYHNCVDNLWLIRHGDNLDKHATNITDYLKAHGIYKIFLREIGGEKAIRNDGILLTVKNEQNQDIPLARALRGWFRTKYPLAITLSRNIEEQVRAPFMSAAIATPNIEDSSTRHMKQQELLVGSTIVSTLSKGILEKYKAYSKPRPDDSDSSIDNQNIEEKANIATQAIDNVIPNKMRQQIMSDSVVEYQRLNRNRKRTIQASESRHSDHASSVPASLLLQKFKQTHSAADTSENPLQIAVKKAKILSENHPSASSVQQTTQLQNSEEQEDSSTSVTRLTDNH